MNLVLVGFMGTGKTTLGKRIARELDLKFVDTDQEVERICNLTVSDIFKKYGETRFRSEEAAAIKRIAKQDGLVVATGGGAVLDDSNLQALRANGMLVCLYADIEVIYERTSRRNTRPLLTGEDMRARIRDLLTQREAAYGQADYSIDTSVKSIPELTEEVMVLFRNFPGRLKGAE